MVNICKTVVIIIFFCSALNAKGADSQNGNDYIDVTHNYISKKFKYISLGIDEFIVNKLDIFSRHDANTTNIKPNKADKLFLNKKFTSETRNSYIKLSTGAKLNSIDKNSKNISISARIALNKTNKRLNIFMNNLTDDNKNHFMKASNNTNDKPELGLSIIHDIRTNLESKYSVGIRGLSFFIRARYSYKKKADNWKIEPVQNFEYSTKESFKENTRVYLDRELSPKLLFRAEFGRGTGTKIDGMDYDAGLHLFWTLFPKTGIELSQGFYGNTDYKYTPDDNPNEIKKFSGVNNYTTTLSYRHHIFKKWIFYQITPGVNFAKNHNYRANYSFFIGFDILL